METITIHPRSKEQRKVFEDMATALQIPFDINEDDSPNQQHSSHKKPSDFFGILNKAEGLQFEKHIQKMRGEWERNI